MKQLEKYFERYMLEVRGLSESSANHYRQALRTVSRYLQEDGLLQAGDDIYSIENLSELKAAKSRLMSIPTFVDQDETGNRMYSAGLNRYIEFAELQASEISAQDVDVSRLDAPVPVTASRRARQSFGWNRDRIIVEQVLKADNYICELDNSHHTFISRRTNNPYLEGHHLIPIAKQDDFSNSLDVYANIIGLCPTCHRKLHYGRQDDVRGILARVFDIRAERLSNSGLQLSKDDFLAAAAG